jgi:hypothetical protein
MLPRSGASRAVASASLAALWRELLQEERISGGVVVESPSERVLAFGLTAFVDETFLADYLAAPKPYLSDWVYEEVRSRRSLLLDPRDVRRANEAGALNFIILHFRLLADLDAAVGQGAVVAAEAGFRLVHGGYCVRRILQEAHGPQERVMLAGAGLRLKSDYADCVAAVHDIEPAQRPVLMGLYADDPESRVPGSLAASLFHCSELRFFFSPAEQRVLARAVLDESDEEIAREIGLSTAAVKKIWRRAYDRVGDAAPSLFAVDAGGPGPTRGKEKRRNLVRYLRYHLHELRATAGAPRRARRTLPATVEDWSS